MWSSYIWWSPYVWWLQLEVMLLRRGSSPERGMGSAACSLRVFGVPAGHKYYRSTCQILYVFGFLISRTDCCTHPSPLPANAALEFRIDGGDQDDCDYYIDCDHEDDYGDDDDAMKWFVEINVYLSMSAWPCGISITGWNWNLVKSGCSNDGDDDRDQDFNSILIYWCPTGGKLVRVACVRKLFASYVNAPPSPM